MKKLWMILLAVLLLTGCGAQTGQTPPVETTAPAETTEATEPLPSFYVENSPMERGTGGVVRQYEMESNVTGMAMLNGNLLVCTDNRTLYLLDAQTMKILRTRELEHTLRWDDESLVVSDYGVAYYDETAGVYVTLDAGLISAATFALGDHMLTRPVISSELDRIYYATEAGIELMLPAEGTTHRLREEHGRIVSVDGLLFDNEILCYTRQTEDGETEKCFINVRDGGLRDATEFRGEMRTWENRYSCVMELEHAMGETAWLITGERGANPQRLAAQNHWDDALLLDNGWAVLQATSRVGVTLYCYDLTDGTKVSEVILPEQYETFAWGCADDSLIWLCDGAGNRFFCWDTADGRTDGKSELTSCASLGRQEETDFSQCESRARLIGERYGIKVDYTEQGNRTVGVDYTDEPDLRPEQYDQALVALERAIQALPQGFLKTAGKTADSGKLTVLLVDDYDPATEASQATGSVDVSDGEMILYVSMCPDLAEIFYHELFHILDVQIMNESDGLNHWEDLNPEGFAYVNVYAAYYAGELKDSEYLLWGNNYFADDYGLISPREDRAQVFLYAVLEDQEARFASQVMQKKLGLICTMLRECFSIPEEATPIWEQYLLPESEGLH